MKEIKAIIRPNVLDRVMRALHELPHFPGVTITRVQGQGRGRGKGGQFVPDAESFFFHDQVQIELFCDDDSADEMVLVVQKAAHTGNHGDGIIMVADLPRVLRIRTGEVQRDAT